jgi:hypothetical protein
MKVESMSDIAAHAEKVQNLVQFLDVGGKEVAPGSPNAATVRREGFTLIRNGSFRCPAAGFLRRCKTKGGKLPAPPEPLPDAEQDANVAVQASDRIDPKLDPPWWYELGGDDPRYHPEDFIWTYHEDGGISCRRRPDDEEDSLCDEEGGFFDELGAL